MKTETVDIENNANGQAIRLPENFRIDDNKVYIRKTGNVIHIIPYHQQLNNNIADEYLNEWFQPLKQDRQY
jgi:antitoxin VapB